MVKGGLESAINSRWGRLEAFKGQFNTALAGVQGSGWAWLVKDGETGDISIQTYAVSWGFLLFIPGER